MTRARDVADTQDNLGGSVPPSVAGKNAVINGGFDIWQRGTSNTSFAVSNSGSYVTADRWQIGSTASVNLASSRQTADNATAQYALRYGRVSGQTATGVVRAANMLETVSSIPLQGKTVTLSFFAKKGADAPSTLTCYIYYGTGTDQGNTYNGWTNGNQISQANTVSTTSTKFTVTGTIPSNATQVAVLFDYTSTGTAGANEWMQIEQVQLELGNVATPFSRAGGTIQGELAACQRYYWRSTSNEAYSNIALGFLSGTGNAIILVNTPVTMRVTPTSVDFASQQIVDSFLSTFSVSTIALSSGETISNPIRINASVSGATQGRACAIRNNNSTSGYIGFSAEL